MDRDHRHKGENEKIWNKEKRRSQIDILANFMIIMAVG